MIRKNRSREQEPWVPSAIPFLMFGLVYYLLSPAIVIGFLPEENLFLAVAIQYLDSTYFSVYYFLDAFVILASFVTGYLLAKGVVSTRSTALDYGSKQFDTGFLLALAFGTLVAFFVLTAYTSGATFFTGYNTYNIFILGAFSTCAFMCAWFANYYSDNQVGRLFLLLFVFCSVLLLGWGSRMFAVLGLVALMLGLVSRNRSLLTSTRLYGGIILLVVLMVIVGVVRLGDRELTSDMLVGIFFAEPLFTSITGAIYFDNVGERPLYGVPRDVFATFIHFIPSVVFPGKGDLLVDMTFDQNIESPFGAKSLIVSLYSNFGRFYPLFLVVVGFYFGFLFRKAQTSIFYRATYFSALPVLLLLFFRDNLVTVLKVMFFNGFLLPLLVALFLVWISPRTMSSIRRRINQSARQQRRSGRSEALRSKLKS